MDRRGDDVYRADCRGSNTNRSGWKFLSRVFRHTECRGGDRIHLYRQGDRPKRFLRGSFDKHHDKPLWHRHRKYGYAIDLARGISIAFLAKLAAKPPLGAI